MEIVIAAILVIIAIVLIARARDNSGSNGSNPPQPSQTPVPVSPTPSVDGNFGAFSVFKEPSSKLYETSIQLLPDGSVVTNYIVNGEIKEDTFGTWGSQEFSSTPSFEVSNAVGVDFDGPLTGLMDESPKWSISVAPRLGLTRASFILKIYDGSTTRQYSILLATEVLDLRV